MPRDLVADILAANDRWRASELDTSLPKQPSKSVAVVTCMDARIDAPRAFGMQPGEQHLIRNAGALVTDDVERSLLLSQYALGTTDILVVAHTDCGVLGHDEQATVAAIESERGTRPAMALGSMTSLEEEVRASVARLRESPTLRHRDQVHGFVYDCATGDLAHVT